MGGLRGRDGNRGEGAEGGVGLEVETFGEAAGGGFVAEELFMGCYGSGWRGSYVPSESEEEETVGGCHCLSLMRLSSRGEVPWVCQDLGLIKVTLNILMNLFLRLFFFLSLYVCPPKGALRL